MRRALIALAGTAAGTSLLLGFKSGQLVLPWMDPPPLLPPLNSAAAAGPGPGADAGAGGDAGQPADGGEPAAAADGGAPAGGAAAGAGGLKDGSFTGDSVDATYGNVQVKITVTAGKITEVTAVVLPNVESRSKDINKRQVPQLRQAALAAQSADFDAVSGASYTSQGYKTSLQSAIDAAKQG